MIRSQPRGRGRQVRFDWCFSKNQTKQIEECSQEQCFSYNQKNQTKQSSVGAVFFLQPKKPDKTKQEFPADHPIDPKIYFVEWN